MHMHPQQLIGKFTEESNLEDKVESKMPET